jgi:N utilization substance protein B
MVPEPRDLAVQILYEVDQMALDSVPDRAELSGKARRLVQGTLGHIEELDAAIDGVSEHWRVDRMPVVDRAILRMALFELRYEPDTPAAVILSEAVRIAKEFSTEKSGMFVNGVLGALAESERPNRGGGTEGRSEF